MPFVNGGQHDMIFWAIIIGSFLLLISLLMIIRLVTYTGHEINYSRDSTILSGCSGITFAIGIIFILGGV